MPYSDPEKQREAQARSYRKRYRDRKFRHAESDRKAAWLQTDEGKEANRLATERFHAKKKKPTVLPGSASRPVTKKRPPKASRAGRKSP